MSAQSNGELRSVNDGELLARFSATGDQQAFSHLVARSIIEKDSGSHFDPRIVAAFLAAEEEFMAIRRRLGDEQQPRLEALACGVKSPIPATVLA